MTQKNSACFRTTHLIMECLTVHLENQIILLTIATPNWSHGKKGHNDPAPLDFDTISKPMRDSKYVSIGCQFSKI